MSLSSRKYVEIVEINNCTRQKKFINVRHMNEFIVI